MFEEGFRNIPEQPEKYLAEYKLEEGEVYRFATTDGKEFLARVQIHQEGKLNGVILESADGSAMPFNPDNFSSIRRVSGKVYAEFMYERGKGEMAGEKYLN